MRGPRRLTTALLCSLAAAGPLAAQETGTEEERAGRAERESPDPLAPAVGAVRPDDTGEAAVRRVVEAFKKALRSGDSAAALALLHPDVRIYEGGHAETKEEYRRGHLGADMSFLRTVSFRTLWDEVRTGPALALYLSRYRAEGTFRDGEIDSRGAETIVLVRTAEGWRIRHIHWSSR